MMALAMFCGRSKSLRAETNRSEAFRVQGMLVRQGPGRSFVSFVTIPESDVSPTFTSIYDVYMNLKEIVNISLVCGKQLSKRGFC